MEKITSLLPKRENANVLVGLVILLSSIHLVPFHLQPLVNLGTFLLAGFSWIKKDQCNFQLGLISLIGTLHWSFFYPIWPLQLLLGIAMTGGLYFFSNDQRFSYRWVQRGKVEKQSIILGLFFILISSGSLLLWFCLLSPDVSDLKAFIPDWPIPLLILGGLMFSVANAFAEEFLFRGILFSALSTHLKSPLVIVIQAIAFGCLHMNGFPRGAAGVVLASVYGLMMGVLRQISNGLLVPWAIHVFADITIVAILLAYVF